MKVLIYDLAELTWNTTIAELPVKYDAVLNLACNSNYTSSNINVTLVSCDRRPVTLHVV